MSKRKQLWIAIVDGEHMRIIVPASPAGSFRTHAHTESISAHKKSEQLASDRPGRSFESVGSTRHAIAPRHDPHAEEEQKFTRFAAEHLNEAEAQGEFDELVLVAPPKAMPAIRERLTRASAAKLVGTLTKDLINVPDHELGAHLAEWARPAPEEL